MQQRQPRLGDILDDYCPRERRVTNHAVVAMVGADVKQTRCTTCDAEHEYKHAKVPRQRRKPETPAALYSQVLASGPKRVTHENGEDNGHDEGETVQELNDAVHEDLETAEQPLEAQSAPDPPVEPQAVPEEPRADEEGDTRADEEEGPVHRPLIRASLPRPEGHPPPSRPIPEFTIRQPGGRPNRFRPRHQRGGHQGGHFQGNRSNGNMAGPQRGGMRQGGRPPHSPQGALPRMARRHGPPGRKRSK